MNHHDASPREPAEHQRFAHYLSELEQVTDADEVGLVREVLADPDRTMAQSAVLRHIDRRATGLLADPAYERWTETMAQAVAGHPFLTGRLLEWSLFQAVTQGGAWHPDTLLASSDWLQLKTAATAHTDALKILAEHGRTKRIRNTAKANLKNDPS
ncbi:hypothetical protein ACFU8W_51755 [Streptomyces sp. NPDC057565]|uniref:hypothetical protein n=1 Tax=Streptomyces sp. NPDC057565 TaxID=3346169 RepID=UPI00369D0D71